ncbi:MazG family protein [Actinomycetospora straminea]|uniref:NTP pyrophosphohydrolase MazG-like domain-containing protein n=1 Tax=Actinomycetospora straminea TaxID=663607 RepID=A0ABP9E458_9PSEU|nr:MazG family protein [Actinomycetospora straminea]MDD7930927.1 MazG family protein [Actinomycetospora straminea]
MSARETVTVDPRLGAVLPAAAVRAVAAADQVRLHPDLPAGVAAAFARDLGAVGPEAPESDGAVVELVPGGHGPPGAELLEAVRIMDRLRSPGGCPWDAAQTPASLLRYLVEETYELYDAVADDDRVAVREELGDVLLQVLFHARIAQEDRADPFGIDEVAAELVGKLVSRHPHVFGAGETITGAAEQQVRWEELKAVEKRRASALEGVARAQPAAALVAKYLSRARRAGVPDDLLAGASPDPLYAVAAAHGDPEGDLRAAAGELARRVRGAEGAARAAGEDPTALDEQGWRRFWPA